MVVELVRVGAVIGSETSSGMNQTTMTGSEVVSNGRATGSERASLSPLSDAAVGNVGILVTLIGFGLAP